MLTASWQCESSTDKITLDFYRYAQGMYVATGIVIAQASGRDVYEGGALIAFYARLTGLGGFAAIVGPLLGGQLARIMDWRGVFLVLARSEERRVGTECGARRGAWSAT